MISWFNRLVSGTHLYFGGDKERCDADELQVIFIDVLLRQHEAIEVVLSEVGRLSVEAVHLTHLHTHKIWTQFNRLSLHSEHSQNKHYFQSTALTSSSQSSRIALILGCSLGCRCR